MITQTQLNQGVCFEIGIKTRRVGMILKNLPVNVWQTPKG
jgi:hypothetical protein